MSTAEILSLISVISFVICGIAFVLAVFFWFFFKIPAVIGDLSGRTARKSIEKMRSGNEKAAAQSYKPKTAYTTYTLSPLAAPQPPKPAEVKIREKTQKPAMPEQMPETNLLDESTEITEEILATELLDANMAITEEIPATELLNNDDDITEELPATELLTSTAITESLLDEEEGTTLLPTGGMMLTMLDDVMLINTEESIL